MIERLLVYRHDNDSTSFQYGKFSKFWAPGAGKVVTSGSSTTVTTVSASGAFSEVKIGDLLRVNRTPYASGGVDVVRVTAKASNDSLTVHSAVDWSNGAAGYSPWEYLVAEVPATGNATGWVYVGDCSQVALSVQITTVAAAGGIDIQVEGKTNENATPNILIPSRNYATAGSNDVLQITDGMPFVRVGFKGGSGFAGTDVFTLSLLTSARF